MRRRNKKLGMGVKIIMNIIGGFIAAYGLESVLIPNSVSDGGITGLSIVGSQLFSLPLGILISILNIPFIYLGYKQIGKSFAINKCDIILYRFSKFISLFYKDNKLVAWNHN